MNNNFCEWFDVNNIEHIKAYKHLSQTGFWPEGFITDDKTLPCFWQSILSHKLAQAWIDNNLKETQ